MMRSRTAIALIVLLLFTATAHAQVTFDWATVGNPGNGPDQLYTANNPTNLQFGSVASTYRISKHEVTNAQYTEFLNAADPTGSNSRCLFNTNMAGNYGGIEMTGTSNGSRYVAQAGREQNPATYVSWYDAVRFTNWLHNGQGAGSTETGAYTLLGGSCTPTNGSNISREAGATHFLPSENEWYKAAYHDASVGTTTTYFSFPAGTDTLPHSDNPSSLNTPDDSNVVNMFRDDSVANGYDDGHAVSGSTSFPLSSNPLTDVGAYTLAISPYGTFDQGGNVWEWNETLVSSSSRGRRGGGWNSSTMLSAASNRQLNSPAFENRNLGFRIASIPEPSTGLLVAFGALGFPFRRRR